MFRLIPNKRRYVQRMRGNQNPDAEDSQYWLDRYTIARFTYQEQRSNNAFAEWHLANVAPDVKAGKLRSWKEYALLLEKALQ